MAMAEEVVATAFLSPSLAGAIKGPAGASFFSSGLGPPNKLNAGEAAVAVSFFFRLYWWVVRRIVHPQGRLN